MAEKTEFLQAIDDAILDADSLERFINGSDSETVLTRLSAEYPTLQKAIKELFENGGIANRFETLADLQASDLVDGAYALVADDVSNKNGIYIKQAGVWVKSKYDLLNIINNLYEPTLTKNDFIKDMYIRPSDGVALNSTSHIASDFVSIQPMHEYEIDVETTTGTACAFYDVNKVFISSFAVNQTGVVVFTAPEKAHYVRLSSRNTYNTTSFKPIARGVSTKDFVTRAIVKDLLDLKISSLVEKVYGYEVFKNKGSYILNNGIINFAGVGGYVNWSTTEYIPVKQGDLVDVSIVNESANKPVAFAFYDTSKVFVEAVLSENPTQGLKTFEYTAPQDGFIVASHASGGENISNVVINKGITGLIDMGRLAELITAEQNKDSSGDSSKKFILGKGGYSWWNEPQSCQIDGVYSKVAVGLVDMDWQKMIFADTSEIPAKTTTTYNVYKDVMIPDEHNGGVCMPVNGTLIMFQAGHNNTDYIAYWTSPNLNPESFGKEKRLICPYGRTSYSQVIYSPVTKKLYVFFRTDGAQSWCMASCADWLEDEPSWEIRKLIKAGTGMYIKAVLNPTGDYIHFVATRNGASEINALWYFKLNLQTGVAQGLDDSPITLGGEDNVWLDNLDKIYDAEGGKLRLYDASTSDTKLPILCQRVLGTWAEGGAYHYIELDFASGTITKDVPIVESGDTIGYDSYYGGAHFSNILGGDGVVPSSVGPVYTARESGGTWYLEEWTTNDGGDSWVLKEVIDESSEYKIWRPRVPFNTRISTKPNIVRLTWCKGIWKTYMNYSADLWALRK